jgi:hypothetical protein
VRQFDYATPLLPEELETGFGYADHVVDYLCNIGMRRSFLYFETPKVACSSIKRTLQILELAQGEALADDVHEKAASPLKGALSSGLSYHDIFESPRLFRFTFVRNPYCRILSCYLDKIVTDEATRPIHYRDLRISHQSAVSFEEFLLGVEHIDDSRRNPHWKSQAGLINDRRVHYHYIGRFEHLRRDLGYALQLIGVEEGEAAIQEMSPHRTDALARVREFFGKTEIALVQRIYKLDFLRYGYSFELPS